MAESTLLQKLEGIQHKFEEVSTLITDPSVISDMKRYVRLNKEYRELEQIIEAKKIYEQKIKAYTEAKMLIHPTKTRNR